MEEADELRAMLDRAIEIAGSRGDMPLLGRLCEVRDSAEAERDHRPVRVEVLGGNVRRGAIYVDLPDRELALLVALALEASPKSRSQLCRLLYPHLDGGSSGGLLKVYIHRVRARLGSKSAILTRADGYALCAEVAVDVREIDALLADTLYSRVDVVLERRDDLLSASRRLRGPRPARMLSWQWFIPWHQKFVQLGREIALLLARDAFAHGDVEQALHLARELADEDPGDERPRELVARVCALLGERTPAIREHEPKRRT